MIFACAVNISLDLLFVASFDMGVEGRGHRHSHRAGLFGADLPARPLA